MSLFYLLTPTAVSYALATPQGATGAQGDAGQKGEAGAPGLVGSRGAPGQPGAAGPPGPAGAKGQRGSAVSAYHIISDGLYCAGHFVLLCENVCDASPLLSQGPKGERGPTGPLGASGPPGFRGPKGMQGENGLIGSQVCTTARAIIILHEMCVFVLMRRVKCVLGFTGCLYIFIYSHEVMIQGGVCTDCLHVHIPL